LDDQGEEITSAKYPEVGTRGQDGGTVFSLVFLGAFEDTSADDVASASVEFGPGE
jgi:hypothetical protein